MTYHSLAEESCFRLALWNAEVWELISLNSTASRSSVGVLLIGALVAFNTFGLNVVALTVRLIH